MLLYLIAALFFLFLGFAQEHPFLSKFDLKETVGAVTLEWMVISGNTCFGIQVLRSFNGLGYVQIGEIGGLDRV